MTIKIILISIAAFSALMGIVSWILPPFIVYRVLLVRTKPEKWGRECSDKKDLEQIEMFRQGEEWMKIHESKRSSHWITSAGFRLYADYFDFGFKKCVIMLAGRSESGMYSCYFAEPYRKAGFNVLSIDNRCHGFSEGKYDNQGMTEYVDLLAWTKYLHDHLGMESVICHGICMGGATAIYALTDDSCPSYLAGATVDGTFTNFIDNFNNHLAEKKKSKFPSSPIMKALIKKHSGKDPTVFSPENLISKNTRPILFLYSKMDTYTTPDIANKLYSKCTSPKEIVWFPKGRHSHIRINNTDDYDQAIISFAERYFK